MMCESCYSKDERIHRTIDLTLSDDEREKKKGKKRKVEKKITNTEQENDITNKKIKNNKKSNKKSNKNNNKKIVPKKENKSENKENNITGKEKTYVIEQKYIDKSNTPTTTTKPKLEVPIYTLNLLEKKNDKEEKTYETEEKKRDKSNTSTSSITSTIVNKGKEEKKNGKEEKTYETEEKKRNKSNTSTTATNPKGQDRNSSITTTIVKKDKEGKKSDKEENTDDDTYRFLNECCKLRYNSLWDDMIEAGVTDMKIIIDQATEIEKVLVHNGIAPSMAIFHRRNFFCALDIWIHRIKQSTFFQYFTIYEQYQTQAQSKCCQ